MVHEKLDFTETALSPCEAEIIATNECATELQSLKHRSNDIVISKVYYCTNIYNDNKEVVQWETSVTSKGINNLNFQENMVR